MITLFFAVSLFIQVFAQAPGVALLKWGADSEGGAPYVFQDPRDPNKTIGFEVDLAKALGKVLNLEPRFIQNQWDGLIPGLQSKYYDIALNGIEVTEDREQEVLFSIPYFRTFETITVRKETENIKKLEDLRFKVVGTLKASLAERILQKTGDVTIRSYDGQITAYEDLANGRLDAVLMDEPIALYYGSPNPKLKNLDNPIGEMSYAIALHKKNKELLLKINEAISTLKQNGELKSILSRWGLWNDVLESRWPEVRGEAPEPTEYKSYLRSLGLEKTWKERLAQYISFLPLLGKGAVVTLELSVLGMLVAMIVGLIVALSRLYLPAPFSTLGTIYIEIFRGTPLLIQLFLIFYGLPNFGIKFSPFFAAVLGLGLNYGAYEAENYRAGIKAVPSTQLDASFALGMNQWQSLRYVIFPQALRIIIPPVTNDFISLLKDSSLVSVITMVELTKVYGQLASTYYDFFGIGLLAAMLYFLIGLPFVRFSSYAEKKFAIDLKNIGKVRSKPPFSRKKINEL